MSEEQKNEQAEKLRRQVVRAVRLGFVIGKVGSPLFDAHGRIAIDGNEYTVQVLPKGELERLRKRSAVVDELADSSVLDCARATIERQAALIAEVREIEHGASHHPYGFEGALADILAALARYDAEKGATT